MPDDNQKNSQTDPANSSLPPTDPVSTPNYPPIVSDPAVQVVATDDQQYAKPNILEPMQSAGTPMQSVTDQPVQNQVVVSEQVPEKYGGKKIIATIFGVLLLVGAVAAGVALVNRQQLLDQEASTGGSSPISCPSGTQPLFAQSGQQLRPGTRVGSGGTVNSSEGDCVGETRDGVVLARYCKKITVNFPNSVYMDTALLFDNDPKSNLGERTWTINGIDMPITGGGNWGSYRLNRNATSMSFDYGGDSSHFNVCIGQPSNTPTQTPAPTLTPTRVPSPSITATITVTPRLSNTVTLTPLPTQTPTLTPTMGLQASARCNDVKVYDSAGNLLSPSELSLLQAGDTITLAVSGTTNQGSFDRARFYVNNNSIGETSDTNNSGEFVIEYEIPSGGVTTFTLKGQVHHSSFNWI